MPNYHVPDVEDALVTLGVAGLPERLVIDASHDNSGKDPEKQFFAAGEIADQVADGNKAIVGDDAGVLPGRGPAGPGARREAHIRAVDHRRLHRLGATRRRRSSASAPRSRPGAA